MEKSPKICAHTWQKKVGNLHSGPEVVRAGTQDYPYMKCTWPSRCNSSTDRSKSSVGGRVRIEPRKRDGRDERSQFCPKKRSEQSRQQAGTAEKGRLNETNSEQTRCLKSIRKQEEGGKCAVEGSKERGNLGASGLAAESSPRGLHCSESSVRRYALYRSMLSTSARVEFTKNGSECGFPCVAQSRKSSATRKGSSAEQSAGLSQSKERPSQAVFPVILDEVDPPALDFTCGFDLKGTQFPKRIYIREYVNEAIVDELVDVRNQEDWDLLTYMAPLRPITVDTTDRPRDLRFQDLRDFDVYYYPFDWRGLVDN